MIQDAEWTSVTHLNEAASIRIRPIRKEEALARQARQNIVSAQALTDGAMPLYPMFNNLLMRDPSTFQYANEAYSRNSLVLNVLTRRAQGASQAKIRVYDKIDANDDTGDILGDTDYQRLLNNPNPYMSRRKFWQVIDNYVCVGGTAFIQKVRDEYGVVTALYPYHASQVNFIQGSSQWVDGYIYDNGSGFRKTFGLDDMFTINFPTINFFYPYRAQSPILSLLKEVNVDNQRGELELALLLNGGTPSFAIYPGDDVGIMTQDQINTATETILTKINGKNRGRPLLMNPNFKLEKLGMSPRDMLLTDFAKIPESRVCAVFGVPAGYAQTLTGLEKAGTYANRETDKRAMFEDTLIPAWYAYAEALNAGMRGEVFHDGIHADECEVAFDYSKVTALQESNDKVLDSAVKLWQANGVPMNRFLQRIGEDPLPETDPRASMYYTELTGSFAPVAAAPVAAAPIVVAPPEPTPADEPVTDEPNPDEPVTDEA